MGRIDMSDTTVSAVIKMADGNPGAVRVCCEILQTAEAIDPDAFGGGLLYLLALDDLGIYGPRIWMLYKDVCNQNLVDTIGVLRAHQLGFVSTSVLNEAINNYGAGLVVEDALVAVREFLPNFVEAPND